MENVTIKVQNTSDLPLPNYQTEYSAGMDLLAAIDADVTIAPSERAIIPTGLHIELPEGYELQIRGRSGLAAKSGIMPANGIGTIDADYRGEIGVILLNTSREPFVVHRGDRIAQGIVAQFEHAVWQEVNEVSETARGAGGFGSTGTSGGHV
jgi:dUTP pyrophosphatase